MLETSVASVLSPSNSRSSWPENYQKNLANLRRSRAIGLFIASQRPGGPVREDGSLAFLEWSRVVAYSFTASSKRCGVDHY